MSIYKVKNLERVSIKDDASLRKIIEDGYKYVPIINLLYTGEGEEFKIAGIDGYFKLTYIVAKTFRPKNGEWKFDWYFTIGWLNETSGLLAYNESLCASRTGFGIHINEKTDLGNLKEFDGKILKTEEVLEILQSLKMKELMEVGSD